MEAITQVYIKHLRGEYPSFMSYFITLFPVSLCMDDPTFSIDLRHKILDDLWYRNECSHWCTLVARFDLYTIVPLDECLTHLLYNSDVNNLICLLSPSIMCMFLEIANRLCLPTLHSQYSSRMNKIGSTAAKVAEKLNFSVLPYPGIVICSKMGSLMWMVQSLCKIMTECGNPRFNDDEIADSYFDNILALIESIIPHDGSLSTKVWMVKAAIELLGRNPISGHYASKLAEQYNVNHFSNSNVYRKKTPVKHSGKWYDSEAPILWVGSIEHLDTFHGLVETCRLLGMDCEWTGNQLSTIQLALWANGKQSVFIFDALCLTAHELVQYLLPLWQSSVLFLGFSHRQDFTKISETTQNALSMPKNLLDIQEFVKAKHPKIQGLSLQHVCQFLFSLKLDKRPRMGNWNKRPLSNTLLCYAGIINSFSL